MSFSGFLDGQAGIGRGLSVGPSTGFTDVLGAGITEGWTNPRNFGGAVQFQGIPLGERNDMIKQRFGQDIHEITGTNKKYTNPTAEGRVEMLKEANTSIDAWIEKGRTETPEKFAGIRTTKEIKEEYKRIADVNEQHYQEMMIRNPSAISRNSGAVIGSLAGAIIDPVNLATLPFGAGEIQAGLRGFAAARAIIKTAVVDGAINAGVEAMQQPLVAKWTEDMGRRYGFGDAVENVGMAFAGGAAFSGVIRGAAHGLKRPLDYMGSVSADILDRVASSEKLPVFVRDAAAFMSRQAHIDESAPPGLIKTGEDLKAHRDEAQKITEEFETYRVPSSNGPVIETSVKAPVEGNRLEPAQIKAEPAKTDVMEINQTQNQVVKSLPKSEYLNTPDIPTKENLDKFGKSEDVPLDMVRSTQSKMEWDKFKKGESPGALINGYGDKPVAVKLENGEYLVFDGHHRAVTAINDGKKSMPMHVVEAKKYDPANAGRKSVKPKKEEIDNLLKDLGVNDKMDDIAPPERINPPELPEGLSPEVSADRVAIAENDMKSIVDEIGDEQISLDDGRVVSIKDFSEEIQAKKRIIEAAKTCRIS
jgi:hypothetical protein